jgi:outer membrane protein TolC
MIAARMRHTFILLFVAGLVFSLSGCRVGPQYVRPVAPTAPAFKEILPDNFKSEDGWKPGQPSDAKLKGDWWTLFNDAQLNVLEAQIDPANQSLKEAEANFPTARAATSDIALAQYDGTVAAYRQTTLTAFQQVEDNLNALHNLEIEAGQQHDATASAQQSLDLFNIRYEDGVDNYLQIIPWQTALLENELNDIAITQRRFEASVLLVKALGGGWNTSQLPQQP